MSRAQPRIVSLQELQLRLIPVCRGDQWALGSIVDLWKKGAPIPTLPGQPEKRILLPTQFKKWWDDVHQRLGIDTSAEDAYGNLSSKLSTSGLVVPTRRRGIRA